MLIQNYWWRVQNPNFGRHFLEVNFLFYHLDQLLKVGTDFKRFRIFIQFNFLDEEIEQPFITERPEVLMKNRNFNMDMMIGYTTQVIIF